MNPIRLALLALPLCAFTLTLHADEIDVGELAGACSQCHGPAGDAAIPGWPPLVKMSKEEIMDKLNGHRAGRVPDSTMSKVAFELSDAQINAIAEYYAAGGK
jgi:cytochrome c553